MYHVKEGETRRREGKSRKEKTTKLLAVSVRDP